MVYTTLTETALLIAYNAHEGQVDKSGLPYIHHPLHLAEQFDDELLVATALLHDVVEDTPITCSDLLKQNVPYTVVEAVDAITHRDNEAYDDYLKRVAANHLAKQVKIADLQHNMDVTRLRPDNCLKPWDEKVVNARREKYKSAYKFLTGG